MVAHEGFEIAVHEIDGEFFARITRPGAVRHFQPKGTHTRVFSVDYGPFDSAANAEDIAKAAISEGFWEI
ncbi:MAG: hypothetical protein ACREHE_15590 [Rhizomicrobium sp.]